MGLFRLLAIHRIFISLISCTSTASSDALTPAQNLTDGQTLVSSNQRFELGFFSPGNSSNRYLGIWYHSLPLTVVWVANRNRPITGKFGRLTLADNGTLLLYNKSVDVVWSSSNTTAVASSPILQLLGSGNLVVKDQKNDEVSDGSFVWESFDYISDTLLPGMKLGWKLKMGSNRLMTSWRSNEDPSEGEFTFSLDPPESPQLVLRKRSEKQYRWGPWNGVRFSGSNELKPNPVFQPIFSSDLDEVFYTYEVVNESVLSRFVITQLGSVQYWTWRNDGWVMMVTLNRDYCDIYGLCGPYGNCFSPDNGNCQCLKGFTPKSPEDWRLIDRSEGCSRRHELNCSNGDGFVKYSGLKLPDKSVVWKNYSDCRAECLRRCNCLAYTNINVSGNGIECVVWLDDLIDIRNFPDGGEELHIRMARGELGMCVVHPSFRYFKIYIN